MQVEDLEIYESWNINIPPLPDRSTLYSLPPIGLGTGDVEGLNSYICRLAEAHCVSPTNLLRYEIAPGRRKRQSKTKSVNVHSHPSGDNRVAAKYLKALERLTLQPDLSELNLSSYLVGKRPMGNILSSLFADRVVSMFKTHREWCPVCLQEQHDRGDIIYEPLLWSLRMVSMCPHHDRLLDRVCPHCREFQPTICAKTRVGRCSHCHGWLGGEFSTLDIALELEQRVWLSWLAELGLRLLAAPQHRVTAEMRREMVEFLKGSAQGYRRADWWRGYSADAPLEEISDDDRWIVVKILAGEMVI